MIMKRLSRFDFTIYKMSCVDEIKKGNINDDIK